MDLSFLNPTGWNSEPFILLIVLALVLRWRLSRPDTTLQRILGEALAIVPAVVLYFLVRGFVNARFDEASANAQRIIDLERWLGIYYEIDLQQRILGSDPVVNAVNWIYIWGHWPLITAVVVWLVLFHARDYPTYRNAMLLSGAVGMLIFATFPVAPPRLMEGLEVVDTVTQRSGSYRVLQPPGLTNPYAAMPSLHFGWNLLMGIAIYRQSRHLAGKLFGVLMPVAMLVAIVLTANHYFLDGVVGGLVILLSFGLLYSGGRLRQWWHRRPESTPLTGQVPGPGAVSRLLPGHRPLVVAHRAGNDLWMLRRAEAAGADIIEADVWLHRGQLEVRHTKTLGPVPVLWDRWSIEHADARPRLLLDRVLRTAGPDSLLMLDLKGRNPEISRAVIAELEAHLPGRPVMVCSQNWTLLEPFQEYEHALIVYSIGNAWQLRRSWEHLTGDECDAISIQYQLLDDELALLLKQRVPLVLTWAINSRTRFETVQRWGLDGVITDDLRVVPPRPVPAAPEREQLLAT